MKARSALLTLIPVVAVAAGCTPAPRPMTEDEKIVRSVLALLTSGQGGVCVDDHTSADALTIFRQIALAPRASRRELRWAAPTPLQPADGRVSATPIALDGRSPEGSLSASPPPAVLNGLAQMRLNNAARTLSTAPGRLENEVAIRRAWTPSGVSVKWWLLNRVRGDCEPLFMVSNPVRDRRTGFVTVQVEHQATLYALQRNGSSWQVIAEWRRWLY